MTKANGKRAQAATEYLILVAVVLVISLIVAQLLGVISFTGGATTRATYAYWDTAPVSLTGWAVDPDGDVNIMIKNNQPHNVKITSIKLDGEEVLSTNITLSIGELNKITGAISDTGSLNDKYTYDVEITYYDENTGKTYLFTGGSISGSFGSITT